MPEELKACPFCGGDAEVVQGSNTDFVTVSCRKCHASAHPYLDNRERAIKTWNTRASRPREKVIEECISFIHRATAIPMGAKNPTRDAKVIVGEWIIEQMRLALLSLSPQTRERTET